jgi:hypothetical protein
VPTRNAFSPFLLNVFCSALLFTVPEGSMHTALIASLNVTEDSLKSSAPKVKITAAPLSAPLEKGKIKDYQRIFTVTLVSTLK